MRWRIGPEVVKIDTNGCCGNMDISENLEVRLGSPKPSPYLKSSPAPTFISPLYNLSSNKQASPLLLLVNPSYSFIFSSLTVRVILAA